MAIDTRARQAIALDFERKPFYSTAEVAHILGISDETVRSRIEDQTNIENLKRTMRASWTSGTALQ